jgi:predicted small secreted protein
MFFCLGSQVKEISMKIKLKIVMIGFALISALVLNGCHTAAGFGQDMEQGGQAIQTAATTSE